MLLWVCSIPFLLASALFTVRGDLDDFSELDLQKTLTEMREKEERRSQYVPTYPTLPLRCHRISHIILSDAIVEIEDGSQWQISDGQIDKLKAWNKGDLLTISPYRNVFLQGDDGYVLTNKSRQQSLKSTLHKTPHRDNPHSHYLRAINYKTGEVHLENNTVWKVARMSLYRLDHWRLNDTVIIGINDSFWYSDQDTIFINASTGDYVYIQMLY